MAAPAHAMHEFGDREALARALSADIADRLKQAIAAHGVATLAVSGGTTPRLMFERLAGHELPWDRVVVTLVDERFVPPDSPRSNERLVAENLLQGPAARARFIPLYRHAPDLPDAMREAESELRSVRWPLDVVVLGMGNDGHTASLFPGLPNLAQLLDPASPAMLGAAIVPAPGETRATLTMAEAMMNPHTGGNAGELRLTLTLPRIASAQCLALHIEGADKRAVLDRALGGADLPIRRVLEAAITPTQIYWAP